MSISIERFGSEWDNDTYETIQVNVRIIVETKFIADDKNNVYPWEDVLQARLWLVIPNDDFDNICICAGINPVAARERFIKMYGKEPWRANVRRSHRKLL